MTLADPRLVKTLNIYFAEHLPKLPEIYRWPVPQDLKDGAHSAPYQENRHFKSRMTEAWQKGDPSEWLQIAKDVIQNWGGIRSHKPDTISSYVDMAANTDGNRGITPDLPYKGVASYSKLLAIADPQQYAIYDARVAVSLNAIQCLYGGTALGSFAFRYLSGRNNTTGHSGKRGGFSYTEGYRFQDLKARGWASVRRDETYCHYLQTLHACADHFSDYDLCDLEMLLFADAENLSKLAAARDGRQIISRR